MLNVQSQNINTDFRIAKERFSEAMITYVKMNFSPSEWLQVSQSVMNEDRVEAFISAFPILDDREKSMVLAYLTGKIESIPDEVDIKIVKHIYGQVINEVGEIRKEGLADFRVQRWLIWFPERTQRLLYPIVRKFFK
jgi:hypothetical protein